jgi:hypothetical protein
MVAAVAITRKDYTAEQLRDSAKRTKDADGWCWRASHAPRRRLPAVSHSCRGERKSGPFVKLGLLA